MKKVHNFSRRPWVVSQEHRTPELEREAVNNCIRMFKKENPGVKYVAHSGVDSDGNARGFVMTRAEA